MCSGKMVTKKNDINLRSLSAINDESLYHFSEVSACQSAFCVSPMEKHQGIETPQPTEHQEIE